MCLLLNLKMHSPSLSIKENDNDPDSNWMMTHASYNRGVIGHHSKLRNKSMVESGNWV